ncbi:MULTISPECIES: PP2C family protein-serine/threonine phosphatase [Arthrospira]|jgi:sigma-B regulation protein RsbU (phosphoserine phosphatase)|uniref:Two-component response regulator n=1 Tax=Limnospira platensis NIES-46 TaxID=1236695 RepID=A0A5M3TBV0_LIMPL|nr:SpoIIE family protein phosphatase [Arthrospira platensis]AMW31881.1 regulator [Arthrospira platensis YZ]KDR57032.1 regulator [Arthrospira platensis str. Paraca]MBD2668957.1 SpoIIE family protein phosphatase [Arthrospira platensis FACHB-439]MBD2709393.1 SpoIIE family protein phosphatase [Arthrospira platensis FACHB-835]MDF2208844.1 SpoIIE family protein phosphatase [Arthrospira platensis NCB002]MDT9182117.1 SpoIIE family protein phosphatase [Limnospira sp. PMC 289.06]MDT9294262.1 SpoIIE fa
MFKILVIDDDTIIRELLKRTLKKQGYDVVVASNGEEGIEKAKELRPALMICDWIMPRLTGIEVCRQVKAMPELSTTQFFLLTSLTAVDDRVKGLDAGADDFLSKPIEMNELYARVRAGLRLHQLSQDLQTQKQLLETELSEAAEYVRSLLPEPLEEPVRIEAKFIPSRQLGGDCFDYSWLDADHLSIYLLDTSGHGLRAALPSVSVLNLLRSRAIPNINYYQPSDVLRSLNTTFQMTYQNDKYFTIWYGVYNRISRQLTYSSAGHPPAILLSGKNPNNLQFQQLKTPGMPVGMFLEAAYIDASCHVEKNSNLYIFSDGVYEIHQPGGNIWGMDAFIKLLMRNNNFKTGSLNSILESVQTINFDHPFEDDFSLIKVSLP